MSSWLWAVACVRDSAIDENVVPLNLPSDPSQSGLPVGVRTVQTPDGSTVEVWYPASDAAIDMPTESVDLRLYLSDEISERLGPVDLPLIPTAAVRDAALREGHAPFPVLVFSHGFGGVRTQSVSLTTHLASRGYVVLATEHAGRSLGDLLPCLFQPPLDSCEISTEDQGVADLLELASWISAAPPSWLMGHVDSDHIGLLGHSAGGGSVITAVNSAVDRFDAVMPMAGGGSLLTEIPSLRMAATCDGIVDEASLSLAHDQSQEESYLTITAAGHLAFSDLCTLQLPDFAARYLTTRDDINSILLDQLLALASDGCPGVAVASPCGESSYLDLTISDLIVRHYATTFFDDALYAMGPGPRGGLFPEAVLDGL